METQKYIQTVSGFVCHQSVCFHLNLYKHFCIQTALLGVEHRASEHLEMLPSTEHNKVLRKRGKSVSKADPNVEDINSAFFGIKE